MIKRYHILELYLVVIFLLSSISGSCSNKYSQLQNIQLKDSIVTERYSLIGRWIIPHNADINIILKKDHSFVFNDYNAKKRRAETLRGYYILKGNRLTLRYNDRKSQTFRFNHDPLGGDNIRKGKYYFVKADTIFHSLEQKSEQ